jgi:LysM repeat protein
MDTATTAIDEPRICPFLRTVADDGSLRHPIQWPDEANRCTALGDAAPQSLRQQEYACLERSHLSCPRFLRGGLALTEPTTKVRSGVELTPAIAGALLVLAASFALSVGFVVANGGMSLPGVGSPSPDVAQASVEPNASASPDPGVGVASSEPGGEPTPEPSPESSVQAETSPPTAAPSVATSPSDAVSPSPSSDRYALLSPCPDAPECWIYVVRSGDNLVSIANYFGVPLAEVYERNPWAETEPLVAGRELRLPPPTR